MPIIQIRLHYYIVLIFILLSFLSYGQIEKNIIKTIPSSADIYDNKENKLGETPFDLNLLPKDVNQIKISKEEYRDVIISLTKKPKKGYEIPRNFLSCNSCIIKYEGNKIENDYYGSLILKKKFNDYNKKIMISFDEPLLKIDKEIVLGKVNNSKKKLKSKDIYRLLGYTSNMETQLINPTHDSYINASFLSKKKKKDETTMYKPKIIIKPVVNRLNFELKGKLLRDYTGPMKIDVDWQIRDISDTSKILTTISVSSQIYRTGKNYDLVLHQLLAESELKLLENDTLYDFLVSIEDNYLARSIGKPYELKRPNKIEFANQKDMLKNVIKSVITIETGNSFGSGVFISDSGYIITNYHVINGGKTIYVKRGKEEKIKAELIKFNKDYDIALLKVDIENCIGLTLSNSDDSSLGEEVYAAGTPLEKNLGQTITKGIISGYREWNGVDFIQTDVTINSGNSGGPLLSLSGEIIGLTTMNLVGRGISGIGFAIPSNVIVKMMNLKLK